MVWRISSSHERLGLKPGLRLDRFLVYCRFARTRSKADAMIASGSMRLNGGRVLRGNQTVCAGDVLTLVLGKEVRIIEVVSLPDRRGPPVDAQSHYRVLDRAAETSIAAGVSRD